MQRAGVMTFLVRIVHLRGQPLGVKPTMGQIRTELQPVYGRRANRCATDSSKVARTEGTAPAVARARVLISTGLKPL